MTSLVLGLMLAFVVSVVSYMARNPWLWLYP